MMLASESFPSGELDQLNATVVVLPYKVIFIKYMISIY